MWMIWEISFSGKFKYLLLYNTKKNKDSNSIPCFVHHFYAVLGILTIEEYLKSSLQCPAFVSRVLIIHVGGGKAKAWWL